jgi:hypothetical protein
LPDLFAGTSLEEGELIWGNIIHAVDRDSSILGNKIEKILRLNYD